MKAPYHTAKNETLFGYPSKQLLRIYRYCFLLLAGCTIASRIQAQSTVADIGKSYANITKLATGGTFEPNDIIEIRVTFAIRNTSPYQVTDVQVFDTVPAKTTFVPGSLRFSTNEGITYAGPFTDALDPDVASCVGGNIIMNLGKGATKSIGGSIKNTDKPSFYGSTCIIVACFRIRINPTAVYGDTITIGGKAIYKVGSTLVTRNFVRYRILLAKSFGNACANGMTVSAASDSLGTFASGTVPSRTAPLAFTTTYVKTNLSTGTPNDYYYAIANNSSADASTNPNSAMPEVSALHRVFGFWDIGGDHTGAANPAIGNPPAAPGTRAGYMVLINSSYKTDTAYKETLSNLCAGTYYEFSAWIRNICPRCGCDSTGRGSKSSGYIPGPGNDSSGVKPNINFEIDGLAMYTSGDIKYSRTIPWKKFGFVFLTKPTQSTASFLIRNNSPGGGGNDWALDDIKVAHCGPSLKMNITPIALGCDAAPFAVSLSDTVRYLFNNSYIYWQWQRSNVGGTTWANLTGPGTSGVGVPQMLNGQYQYITNLPTFLATMADSGRYYRVIVATTPANLTNSCAYTDGNTTMIKVMHCGVILSSRVINFTGVLVSDHAVLSWSVANETGIKTYEIERSNDGISYNMAGSLPANFMQTASYHFNDVRELHGSVYYRVKMIGENGLYKYSDILLLSGEPKFKLVDVINPVKTTINAGVVAPVNGVLDVIICNAAGQVIKQFERQVNRGYNKIVVENIKMPAGLYVLTLQINHAVINQKLVKLDY